MDVIDNENIDKNDKNDKNDKKEMVYESSKELSVSNIMQLIDLNGTKKNFQSQFILQTTDLSKKISICVVNQDELDSGKIKFEETEGGKYSRRVTFQNEKHINHYIAVKKHPDDKEDSNVDCLLVIHMKELPPLKKRVLQELHEENEQYNLNPNMSNDTKEDIRKQLFNLRESKEYKESESDIENKSIPEYVPEYVPIKTKTSSSTIMNSYFFIGIIFLGIFAYIFYIKKIKKK